MKNNIAFEAAADQRSLSNFDRRTDRVRHSNQVHLMSIDGVDIPASSGIRREPTRPTHLRGSDFLKKFDETTLFYDAIRLEGSNNVRIIAPPLLNVKEALAQSELYLSNQSRPINFEIRDLNRQSQILFSAPAETDDLVLKGPLGELSIRLSRNDSRLFEGRRVVFTQSRNNELVWIRDWLEFYRKIHGANAVLFYDNNSDAYSVEKIAETLGSVEGIEVVVVVAWPFKFGPDGKGLHKLWDSDFSKLGMFEHARWRFLYRARSALNCDIDELVVSQRGDSIFERAERSMLGIKAFRGSWVHGVKGLTRNSTPTDPIRFADFKHSYFGVTERRLKIIPRDVMPCQPKWAVVPSRTPAKAQWHIHQIKGWWASRLMSRAIRFRHFGEITTNWKYDRNARDQYQSTRQVEDSLMRRDFRRVGWID